MAVESSHVRVVYEPCPTWVPQYGCRCTPADLARQRHQGVLPLPLALGQEVSGLICRLLGHRFRGWPADANPLLMAHCTRCGKEL